MHIQLLICLWKFEYYEAEQEMAAWQQEAFENIGVIIEWEEINNGKED